MMTPQDQAPHGHAPQEPENVDSLLAESLQTTPAEDFDWKEPDRRPRWWERAEADGQLTTPMPHLQSAERTLAYGTGPSGAVVEQQPRGVRTGQLVFGTICLLLAIWCLLGFLLGVALDPLLVGLGICTLCGLILVVSGLRPRRGRRL